MIQVNKTIPIIKFGLFKLELIKQGYGKRKTINAGVLNDFSSKIVDNKTLILKFKCDKKVYDIFNITTA